MFKLVLEKAEEPKIKLPISVGSSKKQESSRKNIYFTDYAKTFDCVDHNHLWKILKEMGKADHLTCLLRHLYAGQEATVRTEIETTDWFQTGKILQEMGKPDHLRNLYADQKVTVRTGHETAEWFQIGKGVGQVGHIYTLICRVHHEKCWAG